jgi:prepilin-type N-terminal cleavage/methylation domain-containing protein
MTSSKQEGFTIVELMIATTVFAVILLVITAGVTSFTSSYYQGVNSSTTQNAASNIMNDISQALQFSGSSAADVSMGSTLSGGTVPLSGGFVGFVCTDSQEFVYYLGVKVPNTDSGVYEVSDGGRCYGSFDSSSPLYFKKNPNWSSRQDLLQSNMRLVDLLVTQDSTNRSTWDISVSIAFGDADLLCDNGIAGNCSDTTSYFGEATASPSTPSGLPYQIASDIVANTSLVPDIRCKGQTGSQFCDVSTLITTVESRVGAQ